MIPFNSIQHFVKFRIIGKNDLLINKVSKNMWSFMESYLHVYLKWRKCLYVNGCLIIDNTLNSMDWITAGLILYFCRQKIFFYNGLLSCVRDSYFVEICDHVNS